MDLSIVFGLLIIVDAIVVRFIAASKPLTRFAARSLFFAVETVLIISLIGSPFTPAYKSVDPKREIWLQILLCAWWILLSRELILFLRLHTALRKTTRENKLLFDVMAGSIYICGALAVMSFVFGLPLKGLVATSGVIAIVLGLALQNTLGDLFSGISLSIERPFHLGDEVLLDGGVEGEVVEMNWRAIHIKNAANDIVVIPNSAIAKMRIQNHSADSKQHSTSFTMVVDSLNGPEMAMEVLKQAAMSCPSIMERPLPSVAATLFLGDRVTYEIYFNTFTFASTGEARSQLITQLYKRTSRVAPAADRLIPAGTNHWSDLPVLFYDENEAIDHISVLETLSKDERRRLSAQAIRHHFRSGDQLLKQGDRVESVYFIFSGIVQVTRQVRDGRELNARKLGPGDYYAEYSLLTGVESKVTFRAITSVVLLEWKAEQLKPFIVERPELANCLSLSLVKVQQLLATFDEDAVHHTEIHQSPLLSRIKDFFHVDGMQKHDFP